MFRCSRIFRIFLLSGLLVAPARIVWGQEPPSAQYVPGPPVINQHAIVDGHPVVNDPVIVDDHLAPVLMDGAMDNAEEVPPKKGWHLFSSHPVQTHIHNELHRYGLGCYATIDTVGCTSCGSELQFIFGSCRSFFGEPCAMGGGANHPYVPTYQGTVLNASLAPTYGTYPYARGVHWAALYPDALPPGAVGGNNVAPYGAFGGNNVAPYGAFSGNNCNCGASGRW